MSTDLCRDRPGLVHCLAVALRFLDTFTDKPVRVPLNVSIPARRWLALRWEPDATYRFLVSNASLPAGPFDVAVVDPTDQYVNWEPFQVQVPRPGLPHPPPLRASDYLVERKLWPTRNFRSPPGETVVAGRVVSGGVNPVSGLKVILFKAPGSVPTAPYTRTDEGGQFLFRFPLLKGEVTGGTAVTQVPVGVEVRDGGGVVLAVTPATITVPLGRVSVLPFTIP
jgi:hypothetical protein